MGEWRRANSSRINLSVGLLTFKRFAEAKLYAAEAADFFAQFPDAEETIKLESFTRAIDDLERNWPRT
jgi:hypothetical protein